MHAPLGLVNAKNGTAVACSSNDAQAALMSICMNLHCMTSRAAAILIRDFKKLLVAKQQTKGLKGDRGWGKGHVKGGNGRNNTDMQVP